MRYTVTESAMNGTVTMSTETYGIEAETFVDAKYMLQSKLDKIPMAQIIYIGDNRFDYVIKNEITNIVGVMKNKRLEMLTND